MLVVSEDLIRLSGVEDGQCRALFGDGIEFVG
jgi:hypothetical protein